MTTDVHQQRMNETRPRKRFCKSCGIGLWPAESAEEVRPGVFTRVDRCIHCSVYGPPRRPQGAPPAVVQQ